ncbi:hypothetical protein GCM10011384_21270 [Psychrobacillus lasiicapitis]|nr:hypothetical protein GCM10011384_21270 [Psychrobacillus lasiicapitis]
MHCKKKTTYQKWKVVFSELKWDKQSPNTKKSVQGLRFNFESAFIIVDTLVYYLDFTYLIAPLGVE